MKTITWISIAFLLVLGDAAHAEDMSFTNLQQAVDFIATALESTNFVRIAEACLDVQQKPTFDLYLRSLQGLNQRKPLRTLYADKSFPTNALNFKIGGHMKELGYTHIDFIQTNGVWKLKTIYTCR